jgi:hypothetical protein
LNFECRKSPPNVTDDCFWMLIFFGGEILKGKFSVFLKNGQGAILKVQIEKINLEKTGDQASGWQKMAQLQNLF